MARRIIFVYMLCSLLLSTLAASLLIQSVASIELPATPVYGPNLLTNPGFEYGLAGWTTSAGTAVYSVDSSTYVSGHYSCKGVENSMESLGRLYQDVTKITSLGNCYQISGWIKTSDVTGFDCAVIGLDYVNVTTGGGTPEDGYVCEIGYVSGTQDWTPFQSEVFSLGSMPADANALWFLFDFNGETGTAWWDNVSLTLVTYPVPVGQGTNVTVFPNPDVNLTFANVVTSGTATAITTTSYPPPPSGIVFAGPVWDITTTATFSGKVTVGISYADLDTPTRMLQTDIVPGDVNHDGVVNCKDLALILKAMCSSPGDPRWNPNCDLNHNNKIDIKDLLRALGNFGKTSQWRDITTYVDTVNQIVYGSTDHFSYFGIH
jgi:hypothetical protein